MNLSTMQALQTITADFAALKNERDTFQQLAIERGDQISKTNIMLDELRTEIERILAERDAASNRLATLANENINLRGEIIQIKDVLAKKSAFAHRPIYRGPWNQKQIPELLELGWKAMYQDHVGWQYSYNNSMWFFMANDIAEYLRSNPMKVGQPMFRPLIVDPNFKD